MDQFVFGLSSGIRADTLRLGFNLYCVDPLTLFVMDRGQLLIIPPLFDGTNYAYWKVCMKAFLQITKDVNFLVVDCSSSYNAIIRRPTLNSWMVVTSTDHLSVKFPIEHKVGQVQEDQLVARECYLAMLAMDEQV